MANLRAEQASRYHSMQVLLFVFSLIFFSIIGYGYFHLFLALGYFLAFVVAAVMAVFAWYLARVIGTSSGGVRGHPLLFAVLLTVSAAGVYNSLMLYLEGNRVLGDTVAEAEAQFARLESVAERGLRDLGVTAHLNHVTSLSEALFSEIRNPLNCGQGPEAHRLITELQHELPGFTPLSSQGLNCSRNEDVIADYRQRINDLVARAEWNNSSLNNVVAQANQAQQSLENLHSTIAVNYAPAMLRQTLSALEEMDTRYRNLRHRLSQHVDVRDLPEALHLSEGQSLGNAFKLPSLIIERYDQPGTWVYLAISVTFDVLMISLFQLVSANRTRRAAAGHSLGGAL